MADSSFDLGDSTRIWRHLKLNSFLELLSGNFIQVRVDAFNDASEGAYGIRDVSFEAAALERYGITTAISDKRAIVREARLRTLATCWFEYAHESYAMWSIYGRFAESVAIETTVGALREVLPSDEVMIGRVCYRPMLGPVTDLRTLFLHKRPEYEYEQEVRTIHCHPHPIGGRIHNTALLLPQLNKFVKRIIVAPGARAIFPSAIQTAVTGIFNIASLQFAGEISPSSLDEDLIY